MDKQEVWHHLGAGISLAGRAVGRAAGVVGRSAAQAWHAVDPDLRRHLAQLPLVGISMLVPDDHGPRALPDDGHRPVVFVHGLGGAPGNFLPLQTWLRLHGRTRSYAVALPGELTLPAMALRLGAFLDAVTEVNALPPAQRFDLVAHSMGGIVARLALEDPAVARRVATLVTLGTPHEGTYLARYASTRHTLELRPGSATVERLRSQLPWRAGPRLVSLWSHADLLLLPPTCARVEGAENIELPGFTHYGYLLHPRGFARILDALTHGP